MIKAYFAVMIIITALFASLLLNGQEKEFENFWEKFKLSVSDQNEKAVVELTYFSSEDDKEYFNFKMIFDDEAIKIINSTNISSFKKIKRMSKEDEEDPFVILELPAEIKEMYIVNVKYEETEDEEIINYERVYAFGLHGGMYKFLGTFTID